MKIFLLALLLGIIALPTGSFSQELSKAFQAYLDGDYDTMLREIKPLADQGDPRAQALLGTAYASGKGVPKDDVIAAQLYQNSAAQGFHMAQFNLGVAYANGRGVTQSDEQAVYWYDLAARQGNPHAQLNLAMMYGSGKGVRADVVAAYMWMSLSSQNGYDRAREGLEIIARQISEEQIAEAEQKAKVCKNTQYRNCG